MREPDMDVQQPGAIDGVARALGADARLQRVAWIVLSMLLAAVALGLFGRGGPLSEVQAATPGNTLALSYQRFIRHHSPDELNVTLRASGRTAILRLDGQYVEAIAIEQVTPEPARVVSEGGALRFEFHATPNTPLRATFRFSPQRYGPIGGWIAAGVQTDDAGDDAGARLRIRHFTYP